MSIDTVTGSASLVFTVEALADGFAGVAVGFVLDVQPTETTVSAIVARIKQKVSDFFIFTPRSNNNV